MQTPPIPTIIGIVIAVSAVWQISGPAMEQPLKTTTVHSSKQSLRSMEGIAGKSSDRSASKTTSRKFNEIPYSQKSSSDRKQKASFCDELIQLGTDGSIQEWSDAVHAETDVMTRMHMLASLDVLATAKGLELVISVLTFATDEIVIEAVNRTISRCADADSIAHLVELATDVEIHPGQQQRALAALAQIENYHATEGLALALLHPAPEVRRAAATSLGGMDSPEAARALLSGLATLPTEALIERSILRHHLAGFEER